MLRPYILFNEDTTTGGGSTTVADTTATTTTNGAVDVEKLQKEIVEINNKLKEAITSRDEAKGKLRELSDAELIKKGETQTLLDNAKAELEKLKSEHEEAKTKLAEVKAQEEKETEDLLKELPTDEDREIAKDLTLPKLRKFVSKLKKPNAVSVETGGATGIATLTDAQKKEAKEMFPYVGEQKAFEYYVHVKSKEKKKD